MTPNIAPNKRGASPLSGLARPYVRSYFAPFLAAFACLSVESICDLFQPTVIARIVDEGVAANDIGMVTSLGLLMLGIAAIGAAGAIGRNIIASIVSYTFGARLRADIFRRVTSFSFRELDRFDPASLITRQTNDVTQVQALVNGVMRVFAKAPILAAGALVMATLLEPGFAVVFVVAVPIAGALIAVNLATGFPRFRRVQEGLDRVNSAAREFLGGIRVVKAFGREKHEVRKFTEANAELTGASTFALRVMGLFGPAISLTVNLGIVAVLWLGGYRAASGPLHVGKIIAFINYMTQILFALSLFSQIFNFFIRAKASWERIGAVLSVAGSEPFGAAGASPPGARPISAPSGTGVAFSRVSFAYPGSRGRFVLEDIDLSCGPGRITAIIGPTGSGKSSLAALVPRFYEPTRGSVLVGGVDVTSLDLHSLRRRIALVPQKTILFSGTIAENLRWGNDNASDAELEEAARIAQAHNFISELPEGYLSLLGRGGVNLSGGQKQRAAIARALVRKPEILILDDCTGSVDSITEAEILAGIRKSAQGFTCILITQRISAAAAADSVLVLDEGRAVGFGGHKTLMRACDVYRDICVAQLGKEAAGG
jgi:ATP-binding cassette subfamily B multidrug efflux pump